MSFTYGDKIYGDYFEHKNRTSHTCDRAGRILEQETDGRTERYTYDECGRRSLVCDSFGKTAAYRYDKNGRLSAYIPPRHYDEGGMEGSAMALVYENDRLVRVEYPDGSIAQESAWETPPVLPIMK